MTKEITILSGKGGAGKTTVAGALATLARNAVLIDADVDAPDLHLLLQPRIRRSETFYGSKKARIIAADCTHCGLCVDACRFDAITPGEPPEISFFFCEGCGMCYRICPAEAIEFAEARTGEWYVSDTDYGPMVHARLDPAQGNSGKLVSLVREEGRKIAAANQAEYILTDGPPGIGCPVIASLAGTDFVLVVTEPTPAGEHDLRRLAELLGLFKIPAGLCLNKWDLNPEMAARMEAAGRELGMEAVGGIRFDLTTVTAQLEGRTVMDYPASPAATDIGDLWKNVEKLLKKNDSAGR
ncbi:MAG: ATP-binding protein [Pseudomonadota bacterium]|nr:ATP-binding protein [Pseudomonadota bacterium]